MTRSHDCRAVQRRSRGKSCSRRPTFLVSGKRLFLMDSSPHSPILDAHSQLKDDPPQSKKISAYYSLVFPHFTFYIQTLSVTIGRRCSPNAGAAASSSSSAADSSQVDVDLGALKSVSRLHAKIEYDVDDDRFVLVVIGRNGAWVDGVWSGSGTRAPLGER